MSTPEVKLHLPKSVVDAVKKALAGYRANDGKYLVRGSDGALQIFVDGSVALIPKDHCCEPTCNDKPICSIDVLEPKDLDEAYSGVTACAAHIGTLLPPVPAVVRPLSE